MSDHTEGPWEVRELRRCRGLHIIAGVDVSICDMAYWSHDNTGELQANARLIAAAPELLEAALKAIAYDKAIRSCANDPDKMESYCTAQGDTLDDLYSEWIDSSHTAITKAKGE